MLIMNDTEPLAPEQIEAAIRSISNRIAKGVAVCSDRYSTYLEASRLLDRAYAAAYMKHDGPAHEKRFAAELATYEQRKDRDQADVQYRYAERQSRALELELRALQSVGASVRAMFTVAGRGES